MTLSTAPNAGSRYRYCHWLAYAVATYLAFLAVGVAITLNDTKEFIQQTGGEHCWVYRSFTTYVTYNVVGLMSLGILAFALWKLGRSGRCVQAMAILFVYFVGSLAIRHLNDCG